MRLTLSERQSTTLVAWITIVPQLPRAPPPVLSPSGFSHAAHNARAKTRLAVAGRCIVLGST